LRVLYEESVQFADAHYTSPEQVARILEYYGGAVSGLNLVRKKHARVLEIGAGFAWVSRACKASYPACFTVAQDVSAECANHCPWVDRYHVGTVADIPDSETFDLASMTHVIEHLVDPEAMLASIAHRLNPRGLIFITAPHRPAGWFPRQGIKAWKDYSYLHVPAHVSYFSRRWFELMAPRNGLKITHWDATHEDGQAFELVLARN